MDARGTCDGRHRARKNCPDPECYLREEQPEATPTEPPPITDADNLAAELPWHPEDHGGLGQPSEYADPGHEPEKLAARPVTPDAPEWNRYRLVGVDLDAEPLGERPPTIDEQMGLVFARAAAEQEEERAKVVELLEDTQSTVVLASPIEFGPGIYRWACSRPGGYQRTEYAHELPPCPAGWRWSSAQVTAVGGRGKLHVSAAVVDGREGANATTGPQSLVLEITGRGGYCTGLDVVLFARPAEVRR